MASQSPSLSGSRPFVFDPETVSQRPVVALRVGFSWSFLGWVGYAACQWIMLSVMAKFGSAIVVGQFAFALAICGPVFMLTNLQLRGVQSSDARSEYRFSDYLTLRLLGSAAGLLVIAAVCPSLKIPRTAMFAVLLVAAFKSLESFGDVIAGLMQKCERLDVVAIALLLRGGIGIGLFALAFAWWRNLPIALLLWTLSAAAVIAGYDVRAARRLARFEGGLAPQFHWATLRSLAAISLPLGLVSAITSLNSNIPRYAIARALSLKELGIFASLAYPVTAATLIANALGQSALARLSRLFAGRRIDEFKHLLLKLVACGAGLGGCLVLVAACWGSRLLAVLYTPEYARQASLFVLLALVSGLNVIASFLIYALMAARQFRIQVPIGALCMLATLVFSILLVPRLRLMGAVFALLASALVLIVASGIALSRALAANGEAVAGTE